jgi:hypothetical protein
MTQAAAAPVDMVMPAMAQLIFIVANGVICAAAFVYAEVHRRRTRSAIGYLLLLAGAATVINEPVVDVLGLCWFADKGSIGLFRAWGFTIPAFMLPVYGWYVGGQALLAFDAIQSGITTRRLFRMYAVFALVNAALEIPGLNMGIYAYYGIQPFELLGFPLWWPICNALMPIVMAAIVSRLLPYLPGPRRVLIVLLGPMAAGMTNGAIAVPTWVALNSGTPLWGTRVAALVSLIMGLTLAFLVSRIVAIDGRDAAASSPGGSRDFLERSRARARAEYAD